MAAYNLGLGTLSVLPRELRDQVWEFLSMAHHLAFVQASRQIHAEASPILDRTLYQDVVLKFCICPTYQYKSWLTVERQYKRKLTLQSLDHAIKSSLHRIPYEKLRKIEINIDGPRDNWIDPGQIICLYKKCVDLASLLEHATKGLPAVEINLLEPPGAKWSDTLGLQRCFDDHLGARPNTGNKFDKHEHDYENFWDDGKWSDILGLRGCFDDHLGTQDVYGPNIGDKFDEEDFENLSDDAELVLLAFCRLRNARSANAYGPASRGRYHPYNDQVIGLRIPEPFGIDLDPDDLDDQRILDRLFVKLDLTLDLLPGVTANMLRLDRFSYWYTDKSGGESQYEKELERIIKSWENHSLKKGIVVRLYERYLAMVAFNANRKARLFAPMDKANHKWDPDAWHSRRYRWCNGIPPFDSQEYDEFFKIAFSRAKVLQHLDDYHMRIGTRKLIEEEAGKEVLQMVEENLGYLDIFGSKNLSD